MVDSVYPERMQATMRDGQTELHGRPFGPAGTSAVEMADGTVWEVDHADPTQLVSFLLDGDLDRSRLARDLLGPERFDWACAQLDAQRAAKKPGKRLRAEVPGRPGDRWGTTSPRFRGSNDVAALIGTAVLMADMSTDESLSPLVRLAAGLEFVARVRDGFLGSVLGEAVEPIVRELYDVALQVGPEDFAELGRGAEKPLHRFESVAQWARQEVSSLELPLTQVLDLLRDVTGRGAALADVAPSPSPSYDSHDDFDERLTGNYAAGPRAAAMMAQPEVGDWSAAKVGRPELESTDFIELEMPDAGQLQVRVSRQHAGKWVRVLKASGLVPLALVPLVEGRMLLEAVAVVPSDLEVADLVVELVHPKKVVRPDRPLSLVSAAIEAGRAAARYERLVRPDDAADAWRECARLWSDAGDDRRAMLAHERSELGMKGLMGARLGAFVADDLLAVSMGERPGRY